MPSFTTIHDNPASPERTFLYIVQLDNWTSFRGFGPLPGIVRATATDGAPLALRSVVRVENTDGSVHHERVTAFDPPRRYAVRIEPGLPASRLIRWIDEEVLLEPGSGGTRVRRRFETRPRAWYTAPLVWLVTFLLLRPAVRRHDRVVGDALAAPRG